MHNYRYEVPWMVENLVDPTFNTFVAITRVTLEFARALSDTLAIPLDLGNYAVMMPKAVQQLNDTLIQNQIYTLNSQLQISMAAMQDIASRFTIAAQNFADHVTAANSGEAKISIQHLRMLNKRLLDF